MRERNISRAIVFAAVVGIVMSLFCVDVSAGKYCAKPGCGSVATYGGYCMRHKSCSYSSSNSKSGSSSKSYSNSSKSGSSYKKSGSSSKSTSKSSSKKKSYSYDSYDDGYEDVWLNDDFDWDRYYSDWDYALGVDDAMDEFDEDW